MVRQGLSKPNACGDYVRPITFRLWSMMQEARDFSHEQFTGRWTPTRIEYGREWYIVAAPKLDPVGMDVRM